jgi:hypothetical protein
VNFQKISPEILNDEELEFTIGFPTKLIRVVAEPLTLMSLDDITITSADDTIRYKSNAGPVPIKAVDVDIEKGQVSDAKEVVITNKTCFNARAEVFIETEEEVNEILLKSSMNTLEEVLEPEIGPNGFLYQDPDFDLPVVSNVAINATCFGLRNLAAGKRYYRALTFKGESDKFPVIVDGAKWVPEYTNLAQPNMGLRFPGFSIAPVIPGQYYPPLGILTTLRSTWRILGAFTGTVTNSYDAQGAVTEGMGARIGIEDVTGRQIFIAKRRVLFRSGPQGVRNYAEYYIHDSSVGELISVTAFNVQGGLGDPSGTADDTEPYVLGVSREEGPDFNKLKFYYIDSINGTSDQQWDSEASYEVDLSSLAVPLVEPLFITIGNSWSRQGDGGQTGSPGTEGNYVTIHDFSFGGRSSYEDLRQYSFESVGTVGVSGTVLEDNRWEAPEGFKAIALDLEDRYNLNIFQNFTKTSNELWSTFTTQFSNSNTSDVHEVDWGNASRNNARWVLFKEDSVPYTATTGIKYLDHLRIYPNVTAPAYGQLINSSWEDLGDILSDNDSNTYITQLEYPVIAIRLADQFNMKNFQLLERTGREFGGSYPYFSGWGENSQFSVSFSHTDDPQRVVWDAWQDYEQQNKYSKPIKWLAFYNDTFDVYNQGDEQYASTIEVETFGQYYDIRGQYTDRVDFTEYSEWFDIPLKVKSDLAYLDEEDAIYEDLLFGSSAVFEHINDPIGRVANVFNYDDRHQVTLLGLPSYIWRVFGQVRAETTSGSTTVSGDETFILNLIDSGEVYVEYEEKTVNGFSIGLDTESAGIPNTIDFQTLTGTDPSLDSSWETVYQDDGLATAVTGSNGDVTYIFNEDQTYEVTLEPPIVSSGVRILITDAEYNKPTGESVGIEDIKVFEKVEDTTSPLITIDNDL